MFNCLFSWFLHVCFASPRKHFWGLGLNPHPGLCPGLSGILTAPPDLLLHRTLVVCAKAFSVCMVLLNIFPDFVYCFSHTPAQMVTSQNAPTPEPII